MDDQDIEREFQELTRRDDGPACLIPNFEGEAVSEIALKFTAANDVEIERVFRIDQVVRFSVEARVVGISHTTNEKTSAMRRLQVFKIVDVELDE